MGLYIAMGSQMLGGAISAQGSYLSGKAQQGYYDTVASMNESQARLTQVNAEREIGYDLETSALQSGRLTEDSAQIFGAQKAVMTASNMDLSSGSGMEVAASGARSLAQDKAMLQYQAARSAYEKRLQAQLEAENLRGKATQNRLAGSNALAAGKAQAAGTLLSTAGSVAGQWYQFSKLKPAKTMNTHEQNWVNSVNKNSLYREW